MKYVTLLPFPGKLSDSSALAVSSREGSKMANSSTQLEGDIRVQKLYLLGDRESCWSEHGKSTEKFGR